MVYYRRFPRIKRKSISISYMTSSISMDDFSHSSSMIEGLLRVVQLGFEGSRNNWFGLGCPAYCAAPPVSAIALVFLLGILCGLGLAGLTLWTIWHWLHPPPHPSSSGHPSVCPRYSVLAEYAHEPGPTKRRPH